MARIKNRNDRYSVLYRAQSVLTAFCFVLIFADACYEKTTTTTAQAETIQRGSGR